MPDRRFVYRVELDASQVPAQANQIRQQMTRQISTGGAGGAGALFGGGGVGPNIAGIFQQAAGFTIGGFAVREIAQQATQFAALGAQVRRTQAAVATFSGGMAQAEASIRAVEAASGGGVDRLTAMQIVLQGSALGLAKTSQEFDRLGRAARVITAVSPSIRDTNSAITELGLSIANMSFRRLDQLGLSVADVRERMADLQEANSTMTEEMAFQESVLGLLNERYEELERNQALQVSGIEQLNAAWQTRLQLLAEEENLLNTVAGGVARSIEQANIQAEAIKVVTGASDDLNEAQQSVINQLNILTGRLALGVAPPGVYEAIEELTRQFYLLADAEAAASAALAGTGVPVVLPSQRTGIIAPSLTSIQAQQSQIDFENKIAAMRRDADDQRARMGEEQQREQEAAAREAQRAARETQSAWERAGRAAEAAAERAASRFESMLRNVPGLFGTSEVTAQQMELAKYGGYQVQADEYLRRLADEVLNKVDYGDVDIADAARRAGIDANLPAELILAMVQESWRSGAFFADPKNLELINRQAVEANLARQRAAEAGQTNILGMFGLTAEGKFAGLEGIKAAIDAGALVPADLGQNFAVQVTGQLEDPAVLTQFSDLGATLMDALVGGATGQLGSSDIVGAIAAEVMRQIADLLGEPATGAP